MREKNAMIWVINFKYRMYSAIYPWCNDDQILLFTILVFSNKTFSSISGPSEWRPYDKVTSQMKAERCEDTIIKQKNAL